MKIRTIILLSIFILLTTLLFTINFSTQKSLTKWKSHPDPNGKVISIEHTRLFYKIKGQGNKLIIIESGFGTLYSKWIPMQDSLSNFAKVLIYDRGDYGYSETNNYPRTPLQISTELNNLLIKEHLDTNQIFLLGHSFGANQIINHALTIKNIKGLVLLDPGPYDKLHFIEDIKQNSALNKDTKEFALKTLSSEGGGAIKTAGTMGLMFWLYKQQGGNENDSNYASVINASSKRYYKAMESESENELTLYSAEQKEKMKFTPLTLITANYIEIAKNIATSEKLNPSNAELLMKLYNNRQKKYLELSNNSKFKLASTPEHDIYKFEPNVAIETLKEMMK